MVFTGGWRVLVGTLILSAGVVVPATASADPVRCESWTESDLPVPGGVGASGVAGAAGTFVVGNGSLRSTSGSTVLVWKDRQLVDQLSFFRNPAYANDVNSSGVVILTAYLFPAATRWQAGVYTALRGWRGEYGVKAVDVNERGDVLGESDGKPVVWPAGSSDAQLVPGTDVSWSAIGIADDGTVLASSGAGTYWIGASGPVQLAGGADVEARVVRGSHAVGRSGQRIVRWDLQGQETGEFAGAVDALDVNSHGQLLGTVDNGTTTGASAFWPEPDLQVPVNSGATFGVVTDEGNLYGSRRLDEWNSRPVVLDCVGGAAPRT
jgi:hypothetical protein